MTGFSLKTIKPPITLHYLPFRPTVSNSVNWTAQTTTTKEVVEQSLATETDQAITSQDSQIRFEDTAEVEHITDRMRLTQLFNSVNPFPEDTPITLLGRNVQLPDVSWNSPLTMVRIPLLTTIIANSSIHATILGDLTTPTMYRYLQTSWTVTIRLNSTPYHQGSLLVSWMPNCYDYTTFPGSELTTLGSLHNTSILSASMQQQITMDIPFFSINPHLDLAAGSMTAVQLIQPIVYIAELNPLRTSSDSITDTVPISIWVQMKDIHTYGILDPDALYSKTRTNNTSVVYGRKESGKQRTNIEAQGKDQLGESAQTAITLVKPVLQSIPIVSDIINFGKSIFGNLDKPSSDQTVTYVTDRPNRGFTHLTGVDYSEALSTFPNYSVSKEIGIESSSDMDITKYCQLPALYYTTTATTKGVVLVAPVHPESYSNSTRTTPDYLYFGSRFFQYFRGSVKYMFQFVGTPFFSCRFKISIVYSASSPAGPTGNGTGFMSRIVDVKGDAWTNFVVPYLSQRIWNRTKYVVAEESVPWLIIEALTDVQGSSLPADALYYINVWRAGGPDFQLASQIHYTGWLPGSAKSSEEFIKNKLIIENVRKESAVQDKWNEPSQGVQTNSTAMKESGLYMANQATTMTDMCKRYGDGEVLQSPYSYPGEFVNDWSLSPINLFACTFLFWRGSRRMRFLNSNNVSLYHPGTTLWPDGDTLVLDNNETFPISIPWYCQELARPTFQAMTGFYPASASTMPASMYPSASWGIGYKRWIAAGDDFAYYWVVPPNLVPFTPPPSAPDDGLSKRTTSSIRTRAPSCVTKEVTTNSTKKDPETLG